MLIEQTKEMTEAERIAAENSNNQFLQEMAYAAQNFPGELKEGTEIILLGGNADGHASVSGVETLADDYIVEQGVDGIWDYEKLSSGKVVCSATANQTLNFTDKYEGGIYHTVATITFPSNLFINPPKVWLEILSRGGLFVKSVREITKDNFSYYIGEFSSSPNSRTLDIMIEAKGRWK